MELHSVKYKTNEKNIITKEFVKEFNHYKTESNLLQYIALLNINVIYMSKEIR
jgi:hypothetical protein